MAGFTSLGLGLLLGAIGGTAAAKVAGRKRGQQAPAPGANDAASLTPANAPKPPDANQDASAAVAAGRQASVRVRRRAGAGSEGPRPRAPRQTGTARPQVEPRMLLGY